MNKFLVNVTEKIDKLYKIYEDYIWKNSSRHLAVVFQNNMIITFYLYEGNELLDEFHLSFDKNEYDLYKAICLRSFAIMLGNVMVYKMASEDVYYNKMHKSYITIIVKDKNIVSLIDKILEHQLEERIDFNTKIISDESNKVKKRIYNKKFLREFDTRIHLSEEMFKGW